jgi:hypothetical protein
MFGWRRSRELGQGIVEFAVIFPLFVTLIMVVIDGGVLMGRYNSATHAAQEGARYGASGASASQIVARVKDQAQGTLDDAPNSSQCGGSRPSVCVQYGRGPSSQSAGEVGSTVIVKVRYRYEWFTPLANAPGIGSIDFDACSAHRLERVPTSSVSDSGLTRC